MLYIKSIEINDKKADSVARTVLAKKANSRQKKATKWFSRSKFSVSVDSLVEQVGFVETP